jgi:hypothetical protein
VRTDHEGCFSVLLAVSLCAFAAEYAPLSSGWSSFSCGRRPGEHQTAAPGAEYRPYEDVGSSGQAHCGARHEARKARLLETLVHLFNAFGSQHTNGATV